MSPAPRPTLSHWLREIERLDKGLTSWLMRQMTGHPARVAIAYVLAHSGDGVVWAFIGLAALALTPTAARTSLIEVIVAVGVTAVSVAALKYAARRERPDPLFGARWSALPRHDRYSFPSGHAARVVCLVVYLAPRHPPLALGWALWALGVCVARVAVGAHYALDVVAGACLGSLTALATHRAWPLLESLLSRKLL